MKAVIFNEFGGREVLKYTEVPTPAPEEGEVLVRIKAAGVNPVDWKIRAGYLKEFFPHTFPIIPGWEFAGVVETPGFSVRRVKAGDEVYAYCRRPVIQRGAYAEYISLPESYLARRPQNISFDEAGAIPLAGLTAYQSIHDAAKVKTGETVLILGASGGVGSFAVQLTKIVGARVVAVASKRNHEYLKSLGADGAVDYTGGDFREGVKALLPQGADVAFDCCGGDALARGYDCVKKGGRVVSILVRESELAAKKGATHHYVFVEPHAPELDHMRGLVEAGKLKVHLSGVHSLAEAATAHAAIESGHTRGKLVLTVG